MTSASAREHQLQVRLMRVLIAAGATATHEAILWAGAYRERDALRALMELGYPNDCAIASALGDDAFLGAHLEHANQRTKDDAFALAIINGHDRSARIALDAGANVNAFFPVHTHMTALHQAAQDDNVGVIAMLLARGADATARDTLWDGTPYDWAVYFERAAAAQALT